jgi:hypothetical protein
MSEMNKEKKNLDNIIINNYYCFPFDKLKEYYKNSFSPLIYALNQTNNINKDILIKKSDDLGNKSNKFNNGKIVKEINFYINDDKSSINEEKSSIDMAKTKDLSIEIKPEKELKFLTKKKFFKIDTKNKKGRKPKHSMVYSYHTKFSNDNILRKIKVKFIHKTINYINNIILTKYNNKIDVLKPLKGKISQNNGINFNKKLINSKLKDIFSIYEINGKFKLYQNNYNKSVIDKIYNENIKELIDIFEMTFLQVFVIFRDLNETQKLNGLEKIDTVIREIKLKDNNNEYINKFTNVAMNFENYYLNKIARK